MPQKCSNFGDCDCCCYLRKVRSNPRIRLVWVLTTEQNQVNGTKICHLKSQSLITLMWHMEDELKGRWSQKKITSLETLFLHNVRDSRTIITSFNEQVPRKMFSVFRSSSKKCPNIQIQYLIRILMNFLAFVNFLDTTFFSPTFHDMAVFGMLFMYSMVQKYNCIQLILYV